MPLRKKHGWPRLERIPHPPHRIPLVGDMIGMSRAAPVQDSMRQAGELGPLFRRKVFGTEIVFVSGADLVAELVDETRFSKRVELSVRHLRAVAGDGLFTAHNEEPNWQRAHDILAPGFTKPAMRHYHSTMLAMTKRLISAWDDKAGGQPVRVTDDMTRLTLETIARTGFGYEFHSFDREERHPFVTAMVNALRFALWQNAVPPLLGSTLFRRSRNRNAADLRYLSEVVDGVVQARMREGASDADDLLGLMLNADESVQRLDVTNIRNQIITFLVAGHETTSGALSFALYYLATNPEVQAAARAEVDEVWGGAEPSYEQVSKLRYLRRVLDEALRLWPTAPGFVRQARADTVLGGRHPMLRGAWATVLTPALHRDPTVWGDDADRFDPDRFAPEAVRARPGHAYKPFGTGVRACIGRQFALHEAVLVLGMLLQRYHLHEPTDPELRVSERLTLMPAGLRLRLSFRSDAAQPHSPQVVTA